MGTLPACQPQLGHSQEGFRGRYWTHYGKRTDLAEGQPDSREGVAPGTGALLWCAGLSASLPALLTSARKETPLRLCSRALLQMT